MYKKLSLCLEALTLSNDSGMGKINRIYLSAFLNIFQNHQVHLLCRQEIPIRLPSRWTLKKTKAKPLGLWTQFIFPLILFKKKPGLVICLGMNIPKVRPRSLYFMLVHDMSPMEKLPFRASLFEEENKKMFPVMIGRANYIITNSHFTKSRIEALTHVNANKIFVFPPRAEEAFPLKTKEQTMASVITAPEKPYFFSCGNLEPRKNFPGLIRAYQLACEKNTDLPPLYIAGHKAWGYKDITDTLQGLSCRNQVFVLGRIPNESLSLFIKNCAIFISPSLYEGWGFPLFEAMLAYRPSIYHLESSQKEFAENFCLGIDMANPSILAETLISLWKTPRKRQQMEEALKKCPLMSGTELLKNMEKSFGPFLERPRT